jgi:sterol desaturase/sphingolipid hydroxylase (fatty acid hydroxylase superfamily)
MVGVELFNDFLALFGWTNIIAISVDHLPVWLQMIILVILMDLVQWSTHVMLHRYKFFWNFHKVHHSVKEMGFAAHLRYHWMENIFYKTNKFIAISIVGFGIQEAFYVHIAALAIGHLNHANLNLDYGPLKYILNNPKMHIWHHAKEMPEKHPYGMNFGISLSIWDYIFGTAYVPSSGRDIELGFPNDEKFPQDFAGQIIYPLNKKDE